MEMSFIAHVDYEGATIQSLQEVKYIANCSDPGRLGDSPTVSQASAVSFSQKSMSHLGFCQQCNPENNLTIKSHGHNLEP